MILTGYSLKSFSDSPLSMISYSPGAKPFNPEKVTLKGPAVVIEVGLKTAVTPAGKLSALNVTASEKFDFVCKLREKSVLLVP